MPGRILLISHNPPPLTDRALSWLQEAGFEIDVRRPFLGDALPLAPAGFAGTILYGGPFNADDASTHPFLRDESRWIDQALDADLPMLGICQGAQQIAWRLGAAVGPMEDGRVEFGFYEIRPLPGAEGFLPEPLVVTQAHYHGFEVPPGASRLAESDLFPNQAFRQGARVVGLQFHPEARAAQFRAWQDRYLSHYERPGCQTRAEQDALIEAAQAKQAAWFEGVLTDLFDHV
ncbi:MAG: glutamine amidotransferase [Pseudomonadota bacterium]